MPSWILVYIYNFYILAIRLSAIKLTSVLWPLHSFAAFTVTSPLKQPTIEITIQTSQCGPKERDKSANMQLHKGMLSAAFSSGVRANWISLVYI
jgi:hypothetical protein